jgi:hypothetical protein
MWSESMRIARPRKPTVDFKRKRSAPPQATKLLRYSTIAGIVFMVLLGIVFLPQMFVEQAPVATRVAMTFIRDAPSNETRLQVVSVGALVSLSKLKATFVGDNVTLVTLGPPLGDGNATFSFTDADHDGLLGPGDFFLPKTDPTGLYSVVIVQIEPGRTFTVGQLSWPGSPGS